VQRRHLNTCDDQVPAKDSLPGKHYAYMPCKAVHYFEYSKKSSTREMNAAQVINANMQTNPGRLPGYKHRERKYLTRLNTCRALMGVSENGFKIEVASVQNLKAAKREIQGLT
jgi:hypothetical protein